MFMKLLSLLILFTVGANAFGADTVFVTDKLKLGRPASGVDKVLEFDIGAGANNPKMRYSISGSALQFSDDGTSFSEFGSGGGSGGFGGLDSLGLLIGLEHSKIYTPSLAYTLRESFSRPGLPVEMWLMENYTSPSTSMTAVVNPKFFDTANKVWDGTTGWAVADSSDAANITTSATRKIGSNSLSWDKSGGTDTVSAIAKDYGSAMSFIQAKRIYWFLNMPSVTQFASAGVRISDEATVDTNYREIVSANNCAGSPVSSGWNLMCVDSSVGNGTNVGTGWTPSQGIRSLGFVVNTSAAGQTYTAILVDSVVAVDDDDSLLVQAGDELTIYDGSNSESMKLDAASAVRGILTLDAGLTNSYSAGLTAFIKRTVPTWSGNNHLQMVDGLTGAINLTQQVRLKQIFDAAVAGKKFDIQIKEATPLAWYVSSVDSSVQIKVTASDYSAEMLIGDKYHVLATHYVNGKKKYIYRDLVVTLDQNSSYSAGLLTLHNSGVNTGVAVGDLVVKDSIDAAVSCVALGVEESFATISAHKTLKVEDTGIPYPGAQYVYGDYALGGNDPLTNKKGILPALTEISGPTVKSREFLNGLFGSGPFASPGLYRVLASGDVLSGDAALGGGTLSVSAWVYFTTAVAATEYLFGSGSSNIAGNTWGVHRVNPSGAVVLYGSGSNVIATGAVPSTGAWHHIAVSWEDNTAQNLYLDGVKTVGTPFNHTGTSGGYFTVGDVTGGASNPSDKEYFADMKLWVGYKLTDDDVKALYNGGKHVVTGEAPEVIHGWESAALTGQKFTVKGSVRRRTSAVNPLVLGASAAQQ